MKTLLFFCICAVLAAQVVAAESVRIVGSDLLGKIIEPALSAEMERLGMESQLDFSGSLTGRQSLESGEAQLAILALAPADILPRGFRSIPLAFEAVSVVVNEANPIQELSFSQLNNAFGKGGEDFSQWSKLGGTDQWASRQITLFAFSDHGSLALELFRHKVMTSRELKDTVRYDTSVNNILKQLSDTAGGIALLPGLNTYPRTRALFIIPEEGSQSFPPTEKAILYEDYPLALPYYAVFSADESDAVLGALRVLLGDTFAEILRAGHYVPVESTERRQYLLELELGE